MISSLSLSQLLTLYNWFPLAALLMFMLLIARFYEKFSGRRMYYQGFVLPLVLFGAAAVRYASIDAIAGDVLGDLALLTAGLTLTPLCLVVYWRMLRNKPDHE
jgi:glucose-6-phosphate-specific signal transduction histidine kinase